MQSQRFALQELLKQFLLVYHHCTSSFLFHKKVQSQRFAMCTTTIRAVSYSTKKDNVCTLPFDFSVSLLLTPDITVRYAGNLFVSFFAKCNPIITYLCNNRKLQRLIRKSLWAFCINTGSLLDRCYFIVLCFNSFF